MAVTLTAKDLLKTDGILTCDPEDTLGSVTLKLNSSHDAIFVVNGPNLLGVVNPYHSFYTSHHPGSTKVKNCYFSPPRLQENTSINKIAQLMLESKVYFLPVFNNQADWLGIVSVRRLIRAISQDKQLKKTLPLIQLEKKLVTLSNDDTIDHAYAHLKKSGTSRLPIIDSTGQLVGLITRHSLRGVLTAPTDSQKRFSREGQKFKKLDQPVMGYSQTDLITVNQSQDIKQVFDLMLEHEVGSVIVVDSQFHPTGLISHKDILTALSRQ